MTQSVTKSTGQRADELISVSLRAVPHPVDHVPHILRCNAAGTFKFLIGAAVVWATAEIVVFVLVTLVVGAAVAGVELLHPVRSKELRARLCPGAVRIKETLINSSAR